MVISEMMYHTREFANNGMGEHSGCVAGRKLICRELGCQAEVEILWLQRN